MKTLIISALLLAFGLPAFALKDCVLPKGVTPAPGASREVPLEQIDGLPSIKGCPVNTLVGSEVFYLVKVESDICTYNGQSSHAFECKP